MRHDDVCPALDRVFGLTAPVALAVLGSDDPQAVLAVVHETLPHERQGLFLMALKDLATEQAERLAHHLEGRGGDGMVVGRWSGSASHDLVGAISLADAHELEPRFIDAHQDLVLMAGSSWLTPARPRYQPAHDVLGVLMNLDEAPLGVPARQAAQVLIGAADPVTLRALVEDAGWEEDEVLRAQVGDLVEALTEQAAQRALFLPLLPGDEAAAFATEVLDALGPNGPRLRPEVSRVVAATPAPAELPAFGEHPMGVFDTAGWSRRRSP